MSSSSTVLAGSHIDAADIDDLLREHFATSFTDERMESLRGLLQAEHVVALRDMVPGNLLGAISLRACSGST